jgi:hypothetical protein
MRPPFRMQAACSANVGLHGLAAQPAAFNGLRSAWPKPVMPNNSTLTSNNLFMMFASSEAPRFDWRRKVRFTQNQKTLLLMYSIPNAWFIGLYTLQWS